MDDVIEICREYINDDFADKVKELYKDIKDNKENCIDEAYQQLKEAQEYIEAAMLNLEDV